MTEMNSQGGTRRPGSFGTEIAADLESGRAVDLAELYALDAISDAERAAIDRYISAAPDAERSAFFERVRQARETLAMSFTAEAEPPADLFARIVSQLPSLTQLPADG
nr:anti-sigma factor [Actinomycetota bacterium]